MFKHLRSLEKLFIGIDIYGHRVDLYIDSNSLVKSRFGAFISLFVLVFCFYNFVNNFSDWLKGANLATISSAQTLDGRDLLTSNTSSSYGFDYSNFNIYFAVYAKSLNDGSLKTYQHLERYFYQNIRYVDEHNHVSDLEYEKCQNRNINAFLLKDYDPNDNRTSPALICLPSQMRLNMGIFPGIGGIAFPNIIYELKKCENSTENNFTCASDDEIEMMLYNTKVQISHPKSIFDFKKYDNPRE